MVKEEEANEISIKATDHEQFSKGTYTIHNDIPKE
jgi:hypothetical protein